MNGERNRAMERVCRERQTDRLKRVGECVERERNRAMRERVCREREKQSNERESV